MKPEYQAYWRKNLNLIISLLIVWALVSLVGAIILAEPFSKISFFGVSLAFWLAQQGSIIVFVCLIFIYAVKMGKLDEEFNKSIEEPIDGSKGVPQ